MGRTIAELNALASGNSRWIIRRISMEPDAGTLSVRTYIENQIESLRHGEDYAKRSTKKISGVSPACLLNR